MVTRGVRAKGIIETDNVIEKAEFKRRQSQEFKQRWTDKAMYGQFVRQMPEQVDK